MISRLSPDLVFLIVRTFVISWVKRPGRTRLTDPTKKENKSCSSGAARSHSVTPDMD